MLPGRTWHHRRVAGILNVCTANRCRSPLAQLFLAAALGSAAGSPPPPGGIAVSSAGVWTRGDEPIWPPAGEEARRRGISASGFRSRPITPELVQDADLILAATRALRDEVVTMVPAALRKTFTWRELAWLLDGVSAAQVPGDTPAARAQSIAAVAAGRRGHLVAPPGPELDVEDPVGSTPEALTDAADTILASLLVLTQGLVPPPRGRHRR